MSKVCDSIKASIGSLFSCKEVNGYLRLRTPFLYPDGDVIDLFVQNNIEGHLLTDLGETMRWLRTQSVSGKFTEKQRKLIRTTCLTHGIEVFQDDLFLRLGSEVNIADAVMRLAQACSRVSDLWFTLRFYSTRELVDDVADFLDESRIPFERNAKEAGRSQREYTVDFRTKTADSDSLVMVLTTGARGYSRRVVEHVTTTWADLANQQLHSHPPKFISLFDDTADVWTPEDMRLLEDYSELAFWSRPSEFADTLKRAA